jgi:hypothetical protein
VAKAFIGITNVGDYEVRGFTNGIGGLRLFIKTKKIVVDEGMTILKRGQLDKIKEAEYRRGQSDGQAEVRAAFARKAPRKPARKAPKAKVAKRSKVKASRVVRKTRKRGGRSR